MSECDHEPVIHGDENIDDPVVCINCDELGYIRIVWNDDD